MPDLLSMIDGVEADNRCGISAALERVHQVATPIVVPALQLIEEYREITDLCRSKIRRFE